MPRLVTIGTNHSGTKPGYPTDNSRAILRVINPDMSCAVYGGGNACQGIAMRNIQIDGARPALGMIWGGLGLVEFGGNTAGQVRFFFLPWRAEPTRLVADYRQRAHLRAPRMDMPPRHRYVPLAPSSEFSLNDFLRRGFRQQLQRDDLD